MQQVEAPKFAPYKRDVAWYCAEKRCVAETSKRGGKSSSSTQRNGDTFTDLSQCHRTCEKPNQESIVWSEPPEAGTESVPVSIEAAVMFTDIIGSSTLWKNNPIEMYQALEKHAAQMQRLAVEFDGHIIKTIGDAFLIVFEGNKALRRAVSFAIVLQQELESGEIPVGEAYLRVRAGIAWGEVFVKNTIIQELELRDYFGNTVNTASRAESKVSPHGGIGFSVLGLDKDPERYKSIVQSALEVIPDSYQIEEINYQPEGVCAPTTRAKAQRFNRRNSTRRKSKSGTKQQSGRRATTRSQTHEQYNTRSGRLLDQKCADLQLLHGVDSVIMYRITP